MLVCSRCGAEVPMAGHPCAACGHRGAIDRRFYHGPEPAVEPAAVEVEPAGPSVTGTLPDELTAWSPWLAAVLAVVAGPVGGGFFAARNLKRLGQKWEPLTVAFGLLLGQVAVAALAGLTARSSAAWGGALLGLYSLVVLVVLVRAQWAPVARHRAAHPGRHVPGADAFGACLLALILGLAGSYLTLKLADRIADGALMAPLRSLLPTPAPAAPPHEMVFPPA